MATRKTGTKRRARARATEPDPEIQVEPELVQPPPPPSPPPAPRATATVSHTGGWRCVEPIRYLSTSTNSPTAAALGEVVHDLAEHVAKDLYRRGAVEPELA